MTRRLLTLAVLGAAMLLVTSQQATAFGFHKRHNSCPSDCAPGCSTSFTVTYVDKKVTAYKAETELKDVKVTVNEWVDEKQDYKYMVCEPVITKSKVMIQQQMTKEEPYKYTVMVPTQVKEMVKVCTLVPVTKDVEVITYDLVPVVTKQKRIVCETICVPVTVTCTVPVAPPHVHHGLFGGLCAKKHECDCPTPCPPAPCFETITKTVMQRQVVSKEIEVNVTTCTRVPKKVIQKVTTCERVWSDKEVVVTKCVPVEKAGTRTVCFYVPIEKEVSVTTMKPVEKVGTRIVKKCVPIEKIVKQSFTKMVPYETVVKVPVYTAAPAPAPAPCATPCDSCAPAHAASIGHRLGGGILRGCCHKCK
ncbi:MAG TPA: hypothetical protein VG122_13915 [Gemmata sp.]|nr:hypothetical protein [Gemmata sp.]